MDDIENSYWAGQRIGDMTREELIAALRQAPQLTDGVEFGGGHSIVGPNGFLRCALRYLSRRSLRSCGTASHAAFGSTPPPFAMMMAARFRALALEGIFCFPHQFPSEAAAAVGIRKRLAHHLEQANNAGVSRVCCDELFELRHFRIPYLGGQCPLLLNPF